MQLPENVHSHDVASVLQTLQCTADGLNTSEVKHRQKEFGRNVLEEHSVSKLSLLLAQFKSPLILILIFASAVSFAVGSRADGTLIIAIVLINTILGFWQEIKALTSIEALKKMTESRITVVRDGEEIPIVSSQIVPGDIVLLQEGDIVPADVRLIDTQGLSIDESVLTGESVPVLKD
ncbi:MAG: HAD-IC family P-type ATPase, partial [Sulfurimonadaceae bacterium]|nr:HAD-IC family P-type ATPase [Sulfurimonadaceae bacterium]